MVSLVVEKKREYITLGLNIGEFLQWISSRRVPEQNLGAICGSKMMKNGYPLQKMNGEKGKGQFIAAS